MPSDQLHHKRKKAKKEKEKREKSSKISPPQVLILCEGIKTEPNYFKSLKKDQRLTSVEIRGCGITPKNILQKAKNEIKNYDEIWCVFDRDNFPPDNFNAAFEIKKANPKIKIAYSNEAFELWYLLHFDFHNSGISRDQYIEILTRKLGFTYEKNSKKMYEILIERQETAMKNAENLYDTYEPHNPESDNPSTTIHLLVNRLNNL